jgi:hypothetical protein
VRLLLKRGASLFPTAVYMTPPANLLCASANELHKLASKEKIDDEKVMQEELNSLLDDLRDSLNGRISGMTALHTAVLKKNRAMVEALVLNGANVLLENREGKTPAALALEGGFDVPLLAAYTFLREFEGAIDEFHSDRLVGKDTKELEESKVEAESKGIADILEENRNKIDAIFSRKDFFLAGVDRIVPRHRNTIWFEYGNLLEKMLPVINEKEVKAAFEKVTREMGDLYQRAQAKLFHYAMLEVGECLASSASSLDDEGPEQKDNSDLMIPSAVNAGIHVPPSVLKTISYQYIHGNKAIVSAYNDSSNPGEMVLRLLKTCKNKIKEIEGENKKLKERMSQLMSGTHSLAAEREAAEATVTFSSSSATSMPIPPLCFKGVAVAEAEALSTEQSSVVSRRRKTGDEISST